jgi:hypothetical protein
MWFVPVLFTDMILDAMTAVILYGLLMAQFYQIEVVMLPTALVGIVAVGELVGRSNSCTAGAFHRVKLRAASLTTARPLQPVSQSLLHNVYGDGFLR